MNRTSIYRDRRVRSAALRRAVIGTERGQWCSLNIRGTAHTDQAARLAAANTIVAKLHAALPARCTEAICQALRRGDRAARPPHARRVEANCEAVASAALQRKGQRWKEKERREMALVFHRRADYYVANPDGSKDEKRLGEPVYVIRQWPKDVKWIAFNPEGDVMSYYDTLGLAQLACDEDAARRSVMQRTRMMRSVTTSSAPAVRRGIRPFGS